MNTIMRKSVLALAAISSLGATALTASAEPRNGEMYDRRYEYGPPPGYYRGHARRPVDCRYERCRYIVRRHLPRPGYDGAPPMPAPPNAAPPTYQNQNPAPSQNPASPYETNSSSQGQPSSNNSAQQSGSSPANCTCLKKEYTQDGQVMFQDVCTNEAASAQANVQQTQAPQGSQQNYPPQTSQGSQQNYQPQNNQPQGQQQNNQQQGSQQNFQPR
jgi:hypothetical protein